MLGYGELSSHVTKSFLSPAPSSRKSEKKNEVWNKALIGIALFFWMGLFHSSVLLLFSSLIFYPHPLAVSTLTILITLLFIPTYENSKWGKKLAAFICSTVQVHFPLKVIFEDKDMLDNHKAYVIVLEPHSVFPVSAVAFGHGSDLIPLKNIRTLGSSALDWVPFCRHLWRWMGLSAVSRSTFSSLLSKNVSCVVIPGGVQECLRMNDHQEVLYLKNRKGFIKVAMENGAAIIPAFCFGQRNVYKFWFPKFKWYKNLARALKFAPMIFWGVWGTPIPYPRPLFLIIGKPITVPKLQDPTEEQISHIQNLFISSMAEMYEKHKLMAGAKDIELVIV